METVTLHTAKTTLSKLVARVEGGEEIILARGNTPVARLIPLEKPVVKLIKKRIPGSHKGRIIVDERFFEPLADDELGPWG